jgi:hypothetical protein
MGYTSVEITLPVNDKGIDIVANIKLGSGSVREVVQVKRRTGNTIRPVLAICWLCVSGPARRSADGRPHEPNWELL